MMLLAAALFCLVASGSGSFLQTGQARFAELSNRMTWGLTVARETNRDQNRALSGEILEEIANGTVALRLIRYETNQKVTMYRLRDGADLDCLKSVEVSLDSLFEKAEQFLQLCVADIDLFLQWDTEVRFFPTVAYLQQESTYIVKTTLDAIAEFNPLLEREDLEGRMDAEMDHFTEDWIVGQWKLDEELQQHEDLRDKIVITASECYDGMVDILPNNIENVLYYAENYCFLTD